MKQKELDERIAQHKRWLDTEGKSGKKLYLCKEDLRGACLRGADLRGACLRGADLSEADLREADLREADPRSADLSGADLHGADLRGANIDYSCWPLWCGSLDVNVDTRIARQLAYHFCRLECDDPEYIRARNAIVDFANGFHRADECGKLEKKEV